MTAGEDVVPIEPSAIRARRLAPYAREVEAAVVAGRTPNVYLFAAPDAWDCAQRRREWHGPGSVLALPPGEAADSFRWPVVPGGVFVVAPGRNRVFAFELARAVVSCGTPMAFAIFGGGDVLIVRGPEWGIAA